MGAKEKKLMNERLAAMPESRRLFRINAGAGWVGKIRRLKRFSMYQVQPGDIVLKNARPLQAAPEGWPDLAGWETVTVTPDMVGKKIAVWYGEELKATGAQSKGQKRFQEQVERMGGIYRLIRTHSS